MAVSVYGVGKAEPFKAPYHYYEMKNIHRKIGYSGHSFGAEELLLRTMAKDGRVRFCDPTGCVGAAVY